MKSGSRFSYLLEKIYDASFYNDPFKHIYIENFFNDNDFKEIITSDEILTPIASSDTELIEGLKEKGYKVINFAGCITNQSQYIKWHSSKAKTSRIKSSCEGFGMVFRLYDIKSKILTELNKFLKSEDFNRSIAEKFEVDFEGSVVDGGIQKYLDGYEISPHPDIRRKAATFMVNINPSSESENMNHHTHYLKFKKSYDYVERFWSGNEKIDRAWVPWSWTETIKQQTKNNTIVIFSPSNDTMHAVKSDYNHLITQRTQLYGNIWYKNNLTESRLEWEDLDLLSENKSVNNPMKNTLKQKIMKNLLH